MPAESVNNPATPRSGLLPIWAMALVFGVPFLASVLLYFNPHWLPGTTGNRGTLINPPIDARAWPWMEVSGHPYDTASLKDNWVLLLISDAVCSSRCEERVYELRQVRRATGTERARVRRLIVFTEPPNPVARATLNENYPRLPLIVAGQRHPVSEIPGIDLSVGSVVLIDPMGQAMMFYLPTQSAKDILKDLKHLLKVSEEWTDPNKVGGNE